MEKLVKASSHSWLEQLIPDPQTATYAPNKSSREVKSGHYVEVLPTPLKNPKLIATAPQMLQELGLTEADANTPEFLAYFSGNKMTVPGLRSWATPYALSIYGQEMYRNCPFGNGNGYGDGRAISVGEVVVNGKRWEMQLKGAGKTPFCRGADGRAVLRSSVREFLVEECMNALGISGTRALSLIVSKSDTIDRPWYSSASATGESPDDDEGRQPDRMITEFTAIATRVSPSFLRVGHMELFSRRARGPAGRNLNELVLLAEHALFREYPHIKGPTLQERLLQMAAEFRQRLTDLTAEWIRVGFCQGNFNSDNCLVGGRTMDFGPFGFIEVYQRDWNMWIGGGEHFSFMNQPLAGMMNFKSFAQSLVPLLDDKGVESLQVIMRDYQEIADKAVSAVFTRKMGLVTPNPELFDGVEKLMHTGKNVDYTIFWRELARFPQSVADISAAFYKTPTNADAWNKWLSAWGRAIAAEGRPTAEVAAQIRSANPKYVPREWMLVEAYKAAEAGDYSVLFRLQKLFEKPYDEQEEFQAQYYRRAEMQSLERAGTAFMP